LTAHGIEQTEEWKVIEISENQLKIFNVKLKNNPANRLFLLHSQPEIQRVD
jgi:hypothetical protein